MYMTMSMMGRHMTRQHSIADPRRNLPRLIREAESGRTVEPTRCCGPVAVPLGRRQFQRLAAGRRAFTQAYRDFSTAVDLSALALDPNRPFDGARDKAPGRDASL